MKELINFIKKENQKIYLEIFLILDEIAQKEDIISFTYDHDYLMVRTGVNEYYRIKILKEVN